jgi:uncharacterized membrane protein (DUF4010 family)
VADIAIHMDAEVAGGLAVAALAGMAVGVEREWSGHSTGPAARFAGVRTFFLLGLLGGLAGWLIEGGQVGAGCLLLAGGAGLTIAAYVMAARPGGEAVDGTTEMAALMVLGFGVVAGLGLPLVTSAIASVMVLALAEKSRIHDAVKRVGERELTAAVQFAVLALVILPLLPAGPYGPFGSIRPRALWTVVLLFSALNFAGYLTSRAFGLHRGYSLAGLLGGLVSSTAVTWQFSRRSRELPAAGRALALGVVGACTVLVLRVGLIATVLNSRVALALVPYLVPMLLGGTAMFAVDYLRQRGKRQADAPEETRNPLGLWSALKMALAFQAVLIAVPFMQQQLGTPGVLVSAAALGLTDMDALTYSMARLGDTPDALALGAGGIAVGILSNTVLKLAVALLVGRGDFRRWAGAGLAALAAASCVGLRLAR